MSLTNILTAAKIHFRGKMIWFFTPWIIVVGSFLINLIIAGAIGDKPIYTGGVAAIYIYMLILGIVTIKQTFVFSIGFSIRRKDYFYGTATMVFITCLSAAVFLSLLSFIEGDLFDGWGVELYFFHLPYLNEGNIFVQAWIIFILLVYFFYLGFSISSVYRRFGKWGLTILSIITLFLGSAFTALCMYFGWWTILFTKISIYTALQLTWWLVPFVVIHLLFSYWMLRKATV
ncbi:hypothetical protein [Shimazuella kribbensis]|uniref:hypothetical protein n=1 Tax=Shimazuella kribbensis TaxID=139808 RepID=UPI0003F4E265|nr:hypothetical protein [Shimazuella kribbensis]